MKILRTGLDMLIERNIHNICRVQPKTEGIRDKNVVDSFIIQLCIS